VALVAWAPLPATTLVLVVTAGGGLPDRGHRRALAAAPAAGRRRRAGRDVVASLVRPRLPTGNGWHHNPIGFAPAGHLAAAVLAIAPAGLAALAFAAAAPWSAAGAARPEPSGSR
jgi:hypothetical protein